MSRRGDSNARPLRPERSALPTALLLAHVLIRLFAETNFLEKAYKITAFFLYMQIFQQLFCTFSTE